MALCREAGIPVLPRGGGTSQCGQTVNRALVIDCTQVPARRARVDAAARHRAVEPGITLGALNDALKQHGLFFPVDPSTWARCTIGGMAGNNSCGSKSIRYGLMARQRAGHRRAAGRWHALPVRRAAGQPRRRCAGRHRRPDPAAARARRAGGRGDRRPLPRAAPPRRRLQPRCADPGRAAPPAAATWRGCWSAAKGTLAFSAALDLKLWPIKPRKALGICQFPTFRAAMAASQHLVTLDPEAVELVDRTMIDLGRSIPIYRATIDRIVMGEPDSLLIVEFHGEEDAPLRAPARCAGRDDGRSRLSRRRGAAASIPASRRRWPRCARPGSTS